MNENKEKLAMKRLIDFRPEIVKIKRGLPNTGQRPNGESFCKELSRIDDAYYFGNEVYSMPWEIPSGVLPFNSGNGSPMKTLPFPPAARAAERVFRNNQISQYGYAAGDSECRDQVADYLNEIGIKSSDTNKLISQKHIIFLNSTTEAFYFVLKLICYSGDVVLFTAPTYGLFAYIPERIGAISRFIALEKEDNWLVNPIKLENKIQEINKVLNKEHNSNMKRASQVVAFVNLNPCNPTGRVMGKRERNILYEIDAVCQRNGVFVLDDIIYRDLCYDMSDQAIPIASFEGAFSNTITFLGTSKSFGLAGARAGAVVADEAIIQGLRNQIFQQMDSMSLQVSYMMAGAFNATGEREAAYQSYFSIILENYRKNWITIKRFLKETEGLKLAGGIEPESGFFVLVDFTDLLGRKHCYTHKVLNNEQDVIYYFFQYANVKLLTGGSFAWPIQEQVVARISFAYEEKELLQMMHQIQGAIKQLV